MSYKSRQAFINENAAAFIPGVKKWTGTEVQNQFRSTVDSTMWIDQKLSTSNVTGSFIYNCATSSLQEVILTGNTSLTILNAVQGMYYTLIKKGAFTLQLPTGNFSASGNTTNTTTTVITFMYDGSNYYFNFSTYLVI